MTMSKELRGHLYTNQPQARGEPLVCLCYAVSVTGVVLRVLPPLARSRPVTNL